MDWLRQVLAQAGTAFKAMTAAQRASMVMLGLTIVLALGLVAFLGARPKYVPVATGLDQAGTAEVVSALEQTGEEYQVDASRGAVLVLQDRQAVVRKRLVESNVVGRQNIIDYERYFKEDSITLSSKERSRRFLVARQNELARMLQGLEGIEKVEVQIKPRDGEEWLWEEPEPAGVSVTVRTRPAVRLDQAMASSLIDLVESAVSKVDAQKITVVDQRNPVRTFRKEDPDSVLVNKRLDLTKEVENHFLRKIEDFIAAADYEGVVALNIKLDLKKIRDTAYKVFPEELVEVTSEKRTHTETGATSEGGPTGMAAEAPGVVAGAGSIPTAGGGGTPSELKKVESFNAVDYSRLLSEITDSPGKIDGVRLSVILFDRVVEEKDAESDTVREVYKPPTPQEMSDWKQLLGNLIGVKTAEGAGVAGGESDESRQVVVTHMAPRSLKPREEHETALTFRERLSGYWVYSRVVGVFLLAVAALFFLYGLGRKAASAPIPERIPAAAKRGALASEESPDLGPEAADDVQFLDMQKKIRALVEMDPRKVAVLVKRWLIREA